MIIYRFRITFDEQEDFLREVEIQPGQTFLDFHEILLSCADLEPCKKAFFYLTDLKFIKRQEISLKPIKKQLRKYNEELDEIVKHANFYSPVANTLRNPIPFEISLAD